MRNCDGQAGLDLLSAGLLHVGRERRQWRFTRHAEVDGWVLWRLPARSGAVCASFGPEVVNRLWFAEQPGLAEGAAKALCDACPMASDCLARAFATSEQHGVWGGLDLDERVEAGQVRLWPCRLCHTMSQRRDYCTDEHRDEGVLRNRRQRERRYMTADPDTFAAAHRASARRSRERRRARRESDERVAS